MSLAFGDLEKNLYLLQWWYDSSRRPEEGMRGKKKDHNLDIPSFYIHPFECMNRRNASL